MGREEKAEDTVRLGMLDLPEEQRVTELGWSPAEHGHLGIIGGAAGGDDRALALVVDQLLAADTESHLYILDSAGTFSMAAASPRVGAVAGTHELRRAVRVLERLTDEMTRRLSAPAPRGSPRLVLVLSGWGAWVSAFRSGPLAWAEDVVLDIVRDGSKAGITVIVSGERELVTSRFFAAVPNRIFCPAGSTEEGRLAWPRLPTLESLPGRVAVFGAFVGHPGAGSPLPAGRVGQLFETPAPAQRRTPPTVRSRPFRVEALPSLVTVADVLARWPRTKETLPAAHFPGTPVPALEVRGPAGPAEPPFWPPPRNSLCVGVAGDELQPFMVPLPRGSVLAVLGGFGSGKSTLLAALPGLNPATGWLGPGAGAEPEEYWSEVHASALAGTLDPKAVVLADDLDLRSDATNARLIALNSLGWTVILTAGFGTALHQRVPLAVNARNQGRGILIRPRTLLDGDAFGVRFELEHNAPPGRAVAIFDGQATTVQLAMNPQAIPPVIQQQ